jgi:hypothetical protein
MACEYLGWSLVFLGLFMFVLLQQQETASDVEMDNFSTGATSPLANVIRIPYD